MLISTGTGTQTTHKARGTYHLSHQLRSGSPNQNPVIKCEREKADTKEPRKHTMNPRQCSHEIDELGEKGDNPRTLPKESPSPLLPTAAMTSTTEPGNSSNRTCRDAKGFGEGGRKTIEDLSTRCFGSCAPGLRGGICLRTMAGGAIPTAASFAGATRASGRRCWKN